MRSIREASSRLRGKQPTSSPISPKTVKFAGDAQDSPKPEVRKRKHTPLFFQSSKSAQDKPDDDQSMPKRRRTFGLFRSGNQPQNDGGDQSSSMRGLISSFGRVSIRRSSTRRQAPANGPASPDRAARVAQELTQFSFQPHSRERLPERTNMQVVPRTPARRPATDVDPRDRRIPSLDSLPSVMTTWIAWDAANGNRPYEWWDRGTPHPGEVATGFRVPTPTETDSQASSSCSICQERRFKLDRARELMNDASLAAGQSSPPATALDEDEPIYWKNAHGCEEAEAPEFGW